MLSEMKLRLYGGAIIFLTVHFALKLYVLK